MRKYWLIALVVVAGCSKGTAPQDGARGGSADKPGLAQGDALRLSLHKVMDTEGTGKLAGTYLLPAGYTATDVLKWLPDNDLTPVFGTTTLKSDDGQVVMEGMSGIGTGFAHTPMGAQGVDPPTSVCAFILGNWKKEHPGLAFQVVDKQDASIPDASQSVQGGRQYAKRGVVHLKYVKDGTTFLVKSQARIDVIKTTPTTTAMGGNFVSGRWLLSCCYTVTAPEAKFPEAMKLYGIVLASYRDDPHFFNTLMQAREIIQKSRLERGRAAMETSRIISQTNDQLLASLDKQYTASQAVEEREATGFDDYIRGVDRYNKGDGDDVTLPAGFAHAWSNGFEKYIVTDDPTYNPNVVGPNGDWHEMEKQQ